MATLPILEWEEMVDIGTVGPGEDPTSEEYVDDTTALRQYNALISSSSYSQAAAYIGAEGQGKLLKKRSFDANKWNTLAHSIQNTQRFFNDTIDEYINDIEATLDQQVNKDATATTYQGVVSVANADLFLEACGTTAQSHTFTYDLTEESWYKGLTPVTNFLTEYGLSVTGEAPTSTADNTIVIIVSTVRGRINDEQSNANTVYSSLKTDEILTTYNNRTKLYKSALYPLALFTLINDDFDPETNTYTITGADLSEASGVEDIVIAETDLVTIYFSDGVSDSSIEKAGDLNITVESQGDDETGKIIITKSSARELVGNLNIESIKVVKS